jgi:hypothetical protein
MKNCDDWEWEKEVVNNVRLSDLVFKRENVDVVGVIVHRIPSCTRKDEMIRKLFSELNIPYVGAMPEDSVLQSVQVGCFNSTLFFFPPKICVFLAILFLGAFIMVLCK